MIHHNQSVSRSKWVSDSVTSSCQFCKAYFSFFRRRHHCRYCGGLYCGNCTSQAINGHRACSACRQKYYKNETASSTPSPSDTAFQPHELLKRLDFEVKTNAGAYVACVPQSDEAEVNTVLPEKRVEDDIGRREEPASPFLLFGSNNRIWRVFYWFARCVLRLVLGIAYFLGMVMVSFTIYPDWTLESLASVRLTLTCAQKSLSELQGDFDVKFTHYYSHALKTVGWNGDVDWLYLASDLGSFVPSPFLRGAVLFSCTIMVALVLLPIIYFIFSPLFRRRVRFGATPTPSESNIDLDSLTLRKDLH